MKNGNITFSVGSPSPLAHLIEYGHLLVKGGPLSGGGHVVGWVPAYPYLRPAIENNVTNVTTKIKDVTGAAIDFEVAKLK